jgi:hypothetical protein
MAPPTLASRDETGAGSQVFSGLYREPLSGEIISVILSMISLTILSVFMSRSNTFLGGINR